MQESNFPYEIELTFAKLSLYPNLVISTIKDGVLLQEDHIDEFVEIYKRFYSHRNFVYIANRKLSYTVNPMVYKELGKVPNLKGIAVVSRKISSLKSASFEEYFSPVPLELFENLRDAKIWAKGVI
ncbi:hypothetical protein [Christiangramia salexigens]|uniref:STAS/SEC14 domain-containing protein n=1 Tax=Christiangramia salexigens TaxID=1913577 RepID=A0A1L3J2S7_9FLAO|nr:hypothetical protein [Christiangramia salexigens]APG59418.1 hypothetical protein LPB144_02900 [Christiangramia salexigens]